MSCHIRAEIIQVLKPQAKDRGTVCARYPCRAKVKILEVSQCGSAVSLPLNAGDVLTLRFAYTLHATAKLFPGMKFRLPGLKKGNVFSANAVQQLAMGTDGEFVVSQYQR